MTINNIKDFKEYISTDGIGFALFVIINIVVFNFRIEEPTIFSRIILSLFTIITYVITLIIVMNFIMKEFNIIYRMTADRKESYIEERRPFGTLVKDDFGTKESIIDKLKIKIIQYGTVSFLIIDLVSIIFYRSSVILEIFAFAIKYILGQAEMAS